MQNSRPMCRRQCLGNLDRKIQCLLKRHRTFPQPVGQRFAVEVLHDEKYRTVLRANVVEMADVRMIQRRDSPRLSLKARINSAFEERCGGRILIATVRSSRVSRARYTSPMPPAPSADWIS